MSATTRLDLPIEGMSCASCAARIEKQLNGLPGVRATVNYATEHALVDFDPAAVTPSLLVQTIEETGYHATLTQAATDDAERADHFRALRLRLLLATTLTLPVLLLSMVSALQFDGWQWFALVFATPVVFWSGLQFHRAAWLNLRHRAATMDTLVSIGTLAAYGWSVAALVALGAGRLDYRMQFSLDVRHAPGASIYLDVASVITTLILAGRFFEARAKGRAGLALRELLALGAKDVAVLLDGVERRIPVEELAVGDLFVVRPGERIATDGVVEVGASAVDMSLLTGESVPVEVEPGRTVTGGTVNLGGQLVVRATAVGADTALARIGRLVAEAQSGKAPVQRLVDRVSAVFVPIVILVAVTTLVAWLAAGRNAGSAFTAAVAVLIVACPCALGLATPTALLVGTGRGAQLGILIRGPEVLETTRRIDTIVLDKTGTVTTGRLALVATHVGEGTDPDEALRVVGAAADGSEHPVARAVANAARQRFGLLARTTTFASQPGLGFTATVDGLEVVAGRPAFLRAAGLEGEPEVDGALENGEGLTLLAAGWNGRTRVVFAVADTVKETSREAISLLRGLGLRPVLLTGDNAATAKVVAAEIGIDDVVADVLPEGKLEAVRALRAGGSIVAMVGDGVNDAAALAAADLGLAIGTGADAAIEASDLTLVSGDLRTAADAIRLSRRTLATIKGNLVWAFAYNVAAVPLAAAGYLQPMIAAATMVLSSVFVLSNSLRLRGFKPAREL